MKATSPRTISASVIVTIGFAVVVIIGVVVGYFMSRA